MDSQNGKVSAGIAFLGIFLVGMVAGFGFGARFREWRWRHWREHAREILLAKMDHALRLSPDQHARVDALLLRRKEQFTALREEMRAKARDLRDATRKEILLVLTEEQRAPFEKLMDQFDARWARWRGEQGEQRKAPSGAH